MICSVSPPVVHLLLQLFNDTYQCQVHPDTWRCQCIHPNPKQAHPTAKWPILLLSCVAKTVKSVVLAHLLHQVSQLLPVLYAFHKATGTTDCIANLLAFVNYRPVIIVFSNLDKACKRACPQVILWLLAQKGIRDHLLMWEDEYLPKRKACIRFEGALSLSRELENGTPQGGTVSPFLFNILMDELVSLHVPAGVRIFCYADDVAFVSRGMNKVTNLQRALTTFQDHCRSLGLVVNSAKTLPMAVKFHPPRHPLHLDSLNLPRVRIHQ